MYESLRSLCYYEIDVILIHDPIATQILKISKSSIENWKS